MKILVTGGMGFIGTRFALAVTSTTAHSVVLFDNLNAQVHGADPTPDIRLFNRERVHTLVGDVRDAKAIGSALEDMDAVVHLAAETGTAQSMYEVSRYNEVNSQGTAILIDCLANNAHRVRKVVLASSRSIYGEGAYLCGAHGEVFPSARGAEQLARREWNLRCPTCGETVTAIPTSETAKPSPASIYAATKYAQEDLLRIAGNTLGIGTTILRFQNVYGPGQSLKNPYTGLLSIFSTRIRRGMRLPIYEDGNESRDFVHVDDVVHAVTSALENDSADGLTINVGSGRATSILDVAELLTNALGRRVPIEVTGEYRLGDIRHCYADLSLARKTLGFAPTIDLEQGLSDFARWVETQPLPEDRLAQANQELRSRKLMS